MGKADFTQLFGNVFLQAFTPDTIKAALRVTSIHPFNPDVIRPEQMAPSVPTSTCGTFPLPQTSPVRAIMSAFRYAMPRLDEPTSADTSQAIGPTPSTPDLSQGPSPTPTTPRQQQQIEDTENPFFIPPVDPNLYTPSKRIRLMAAAMASTSSGSFFG